MIWDVLTLFPELIAGYAGAGILGRAQAGNKINVRIHNIRDFTDDKHRTADDYLYGGGAGMVLKPEPVFRAVAQVRKETPDSRVLLMSPQGKRFDQPMARAIAADGLPVTLICGRYEGVDERIVEYLVDQEISIGDYVISGGELAALVVLDAVSRCIPGVVGDERSVTTDSFYQGILKHPQYTRPEIYRGMKVPGVLLSGHHDRISRYQRYRALEKTYRNRPDLLEEAVLSEEDREFLKRIRQDHEGGR
ncbi:MAG: tRNA (guanosine(37)-N1)-methyltransferase TrmD [bacterium]|nr:tRNA (guanosine(37)-N1)-methyltransferase TrmD [bacterium]